jgi:hypothetical protein
LKKAPRELLEREVFHSYGSASGQYFDVIKYNGTYYIVRETDGLCLCAGKELKGYIGDIIYPQYDGVKYGTGNYYLKSDRHGIICKWKDISVPYITASKNPHISTLHMPDGRTFTGNIDECYAKYYEWKGVSVI